MGDFPANVKPLGSAVSKDQNANVSPMSITDQKPAKNKRNTTQTTQGISRFKYLWEE